MVNKKCFNFSCQQRAKLDFSKHVEVPDKYLISLLERYSRIQHFVTGRLRDFKPNLETFKNVNLLNLRSLDCSMLTTFSDSFVALIIQVAPNIKEFILPFFPLTSHHILTLNNRYKHIESFKAVHRGKGLGSTGIVNKKVTASVFSEVLIQQSNLKNFEVYSCEPSILDYLANKYKSHHHHIRLEAKEQTPKDSNDHLTDKRLENQDDLQSLQIQSPNLHSFKIEHILLQARDSIQSLNNLQYFSKLRDLSLGDLHLYEPSSTSQTAYQTRHISSEQSDSLALPTEKLVDLINLFAKKLPNLFILKLGSLATDALLESVADNFANLKQLSIRSIGVTDSSIGRIIKTNKLRKLELHGSLKINGEAFEEIQPGCKLHEISVSFDQYRAEVLKNLLQVKGLARCIINNYER